MTPNHKLTNALKGRVTSAVEDAPDGLTIHFQDGTTLRLKAKVDPPNPMAPGASVAQAFERQDRLELHFSQGAPAAFTLTNPGNAVAVRDATGNVVYLG